MDLSEFAVGAPKTPKKKVWEWEPIEPASIGRILGVDQSIAHSGWAVVEFRPLGIIVLTETGVFDTTPISTGHEDTLRRGDSLFRYFAKLIDRTRPHLVVHEYPPMGGGRGVSKHMRPDASLVSAMALRAAASNLMEPVRIIPAQTMKKRLTGNGNADKPMVKAAIEEHFPFVCDRKPNNEHTRDAFGLAIVASEEKF